jgi:hypothetical protein
MLCDWLLFRDPWCGCIDCAYERWVVWGAWW